MNRLVPWDGGKLGPQSGDLCEGEASLRADDLPTAAEKELIVPLPPPGHPRKPGLAGAGGGRCHVTSVVA